MRMQINKQWIQEVKDRATISVAGRKFGLQISGGRFSPCPVCGATEDRIVSIFNYDTKWKCHHKECGASGDTIDLLTYLVYSKSIDELDCDECETIQLLFAEMGLCNYSGGTDEELQVQSTPSRRQYDKNPQAKDLVRPPAEEVYGLWNSAVPVSDEEDVQVWLKERCLSPTDIEDLDLSRVLQKDQSVPMWAHCRDYWSKTDFRLLVPFFDATGSMVSFQARSITTSKFTDLKCECDENICDRTDLEGGSYRRPPKSASPHHPQKGQKYEITSTVMANPLVRMILKNGSIPDSWSAVKPVDIVVVEGIPDYLTWATHEYATKDQGCGVVGIISGSIKEEIFARFPSLCRWYIRIDRDNQGVQYTEKLIHCLKQCGFNDDQIFCYPPGQSEIDENDLLVSERLPDNPIEELVSVKKYETGIDVPERSSDMDLKADIRSNSDEKQRPTVISKTITGIAGSVEAQIIKRASGEVEPVPTPWENVNEALKGGYWPGLHILVSNPKLGKTQYVLQTALHAALQGFPVVYVGLEIPDDELVARLVGIQSETMWSDLFYSGKGGKGSPAFVRKLFSSTGEVVSKLNNFHIVSADAHGWSVDSIQDVAAAMNKMYPDQNFLMIIDYLQILKGPNNRPMDMRGTISAASYQCQNAAREFNCAIIAISSTARSNYSQIDFSETFHGDKPRVPKPNEGDLVLSPEQRKQIKIIPVKNIKDVLENALSWTKKTKPLLNKIFK